MRGAQVVLGPRALHVAPHFFSEDLAQNSLRLLPVAAVGDGHGDLALHEVGGGVEVQDRSLEHQRIGKVQGLAGAGDVGIGGVMDFDEGGPEQTDIGNVAGMRPDRHTLADAEESLLHNENPSDDVFDDRLQRHGDTGADDGKRRDEAGVVAAEAVQQPADHEHVDRPGKDLDREVSAVAVADADDQMPAHEAFGDDDERENPDVGGNLQDAREVRVALLHREPLQAVLFLRENVIGRGQVLFQ